MMARTLGAHGLLRTKRKILAVTQQLNDGIRLLQMQAHNNSGTIQLCHTSCVRPEYSFSYI